MHKAIDWLCKYYKTDVLGFYAAQFPTVVANSTITAKELLNNPKLDGKPALKLALIRDPEQTIRGNACVQVFHAKISFQMKRFVPGIFFTEGQVWFEQRRFALRNLRDFGFGRRQDALEFELQDEIQNLIDFLKNGPTFEHEKVLFPLFVVKVSSL